MLRRNLHMFVAVGVSAAVHLALIGSGTRYTLSELGWAIGPPAAPKAQHLTVVLEDPATDGKAAEKSPAPAEPPEATDAPPARPPEEPKPVPVKPPERLKSADTMGESAGSGIGTHRAEGERPLQAREADNDQPFLSRDPRGPGRVGSDPSKSVSRPGRGGSGGAPGSDAASSAPPAASAPPAIPPLPAPLVLVPKKPAPPQEPNRAPEAPPQVPPPTSAPPPLEAVAQAPAPPAEPLPPAAADATLPATRRQPVRPPVRRPAAAAEATKVPLPRIAQRPRPLEAEAPREKAPGFAMLVFPPAPSVKVEGPKPSIREPRPVAPSAPAASPTPATGDGRRPGANTPAADPAQQSDSESDAFARIGSYNARDGKLDPQFGRKVKTVRPKLPIVGQVDAFAMGKASVVLKVNIDATGAVTSALVHKSSGSNEIDQPCVVAMYEWWFEPLRDRAGNAVPDAMLFTITFH